MSNFEKWKAAKEAFEGTEEAYNAAHNAVCDAGEKRSLAWETLVVAARGLTPDERKKAAEYQFGTVVPSKDQGGA